MADTERSTNCRLASGFAHSVAIAGVDGVNNVYVWGKGEPSLGAKAGALGRNCEKETKNPTRAGTFLVPCVSVHAANRYSVLLHENGSLTMFGAPPALDYQESYYLYEDLNSSATYWGARVPRNTANTQVKATIVACGAQHILLADDRGRVFSWGAGVNGSLGHGNLSDIQIPKPILALQNIVIISLAAGSRHSLCCSKDGSMYSWGNGENGKLGLKDAAGRSIPTLVDIDAQIRTVACGESHSACTSASGELFVWGSSAFGRLGLGFESGELASPTRVETFAATNENVVQVSLGMLHSACITQESKSKRQKLYVWGSGSNGKLGPVSIAGSNAVVPTECFPGYAGFEEVRCGVSHTLVMLSSGEIMSMGPENASWLGKRKKDVGATSIKDFLIEAFESTSTTFATPQKGRNSSNQEMPDSTYLIDFDDMDKPSLGIEQIAVGEKALDEFTTKGIVPVRSDGRIAVEVVQYILLSRKWNGSDGVSEQALLAARKALHDKRYRLKTEYQILEDARRIEEEARGENKQIIRTYFFRQNLEERAKSLTSGFYKSARDNHRDPGGVFSVREYFSMRLRKVSFRDLASTITRPGWSFFSRRQGRRAEMNRDEDPFFAPHDFEAAGIIFSHLLANPDRLLMIWSSLRSSGQKREEELLDLFMGLCRDLFDIEEPTPRTVFSHLVKHIGLAVLQQQTGAAGLSIPDASTGGTVGSNPVDVTSATIYKDGVVPRLVRTVYLRSREVRRHLMLRVQPLLDSLASFDADLDLDPFTLSLSLETAKATKESSNTGGIVYLNPPEDQLPLDLREANLKRLSIYETRPDIRRALEPRLAFAETLVETTCSTLLNIASSLPTGLGDVLAEYHQSLVWCFYPRETKEKCTLSVMRALFHLTIVPILTNPESFDAILPRTPVGDFGFNRTQACALLDRCFVESKHTFDQPWYGHLAQLAKQFRARLMGEQNILLMLSPPVVVSSPGLASSDPVREADIRESEHLEGIIRERLRTDPLVIFPTRRTLEFLRHRLVPYLGELPAPDESGLDVIVSRNDSGLTSALHHFQDQELPSSRRKASRSSSRLSLLAAGRSLSSGLFRRSSSSRNNLLREALQHEEEKRVNYWDFEDDWGFTLPLYIQTEELEDYLQRRDGERQARTGANEVIMRSTEFLLASTIPDNVSLYELLSKQMPDLRSELTRYAFLGEHKEMDEEMEKVFARNILEKILLYHSERVIEQVSLSYQMHVLDTLLLDVKMGVGRFNDRLNVLQQYRAILTDNNTFTQNRKGVELFATQAGIELTPPVRMASPSEKQRTKSTSFGVFNSCTRKPSKGFSADNE